MLLELLDAGRLTARLTVALGRCREDILGRSQGWDERELVRLSLSLPEFHEKLMRFYRVPQ